MMEARNLVGIAIHKLTEKQEKEPHFNIQMSLKHLKIAYHYIWDGDEEVKSND